MTLLSAWKAINKFQGGEIMDLKRIGRWFFSVVVLAAISFTGSVATAWQVAEFGESGFFDIDYQVQLREAWRNINADNENRWTSDTYLRRNRLSLLGAANDMFGAAVQFEYYGGRSIGDLDVSTHESEFEFTVLDAYVTFTPWDALQFRAGKTKLILTREIQEGCFDPLSTDRSAFIYGPFSTNLWNYNKTSRDNGVAALGNLFSDVFQYRLSIMEGNRYVGSTSPPDPGYRYTGRVHVSLLDPETGWGYRGTYLGKKKVLTFGAGYEMESKAVYGPGMTGARDYKAYTYDAFYEQPTDVGTFTLSGAYLKQDFDNAGVSNVPGTTGQEGEKNGWYAKGAYMLGKTQLFGRYEKWSFARLNGVTGEVVTYKSGGINYYIKDQDLRLTLEVSQTGFDKTGTVPNFKTVLAQFQARF
jgi:hypothetical protein